MCYKDEKQKQLKENLDELIKDIPDFIKKYFSYLNSGTTKVSNWCHVKQLIEWLIAKNRISNDLYHITPEDIRKIQDTDIIDYLDSLKLGLDGKKMKLSSINTKKNVFSGFWSYLVDKEYVNKNIINKTINQRYKVKDKEVLVPTDEEVESFLSNLENIKSEIISIRNIAIVKLFIGTGIRKEELIGLDLDDLHFDLDDPYITVLGKGDDGEENKESVPISKAAIDAVNDYLKIRNTLSDIAGINALFISERMENGRRKRVGEGVINQFFAEYSNKTIHPHMLRHYVGTKLYEVTNSDIVAVSRQLRHKSVITTTKSYVKNNMNKTYVGLNSF